MNKFNVVPLRNGALIVILSNNKPMINIESTKNDKSYQNRIKLPTCCVTTRCPPPATTKLRPASAPAPPLTTCTTIPLDVFTVVDPSIFSLLWSLLLGTRRLQTTARRNEINRCRPGRRNYARKRRRGARDGVGNIAPRVDTVARETRSWISATWCNQFLKYVHHFCVCNWPAFHWVCYVSSNFLFERKKKNSFCSLWELVCTGVRHESIPYLFIDFFIQFITFRN